jgi:hydroxypyruvate reductase
MTHAFIAIAGAGARACVVAGPRIAGLPVASGCEHHDAAHPYPDEASVRAGSRALELARRASEECPLVLLLSGGASSMLALPAPGLTLRHKQETARALMAAGADIAELNCVRKHISAIKGGQLAAAARSCVTLAVSDVHGPVADDPAVIGSGPTVSDPTTFPGALEIVRNVADVPREVREHLERGSRGELPETIKPGDPRLAGARYEIIGNRADAAAGASAEAEVLGYAVTVLPEPTHGEARIAGPRFLREARRIAAGSLRPLCVLGTGETTVRVKGEGVGGRNQEFALSVIETIGAVGRAAVLASAGTDGTDGPTRAAGAIVDSSTLERAQRIGVDWRTSLEENDACHFFEPLGDLIIWGPTGTNVGDVHVVLIA